MSEEYEVPAAHEHHIEHEAQHGVALSQQVAIFTAILATLGAVVSYLGGHTQNNALIYKNEAVLSRTMASDQWAYYQAKGIKQEIAESEAQSTTDPARIAALKADIKRYGEEKEQSKQQAEKFEKASEEANQQSEHALHPHEKLAMAMTLIQIAISAASITALTRKRWLFGLALVSAAGGILMWILAFVLV
ncbi:DUF4337 domain-containing protein [Nevskia soli]|uniref:DUF4337 domain-containing protein n=1 Tax=Nevskia soli TaxID=418856 RepID=UPI0004A7864B|nr:DUF4337 domain-containing protein [Nevskia soli]